MIERLRLLHLDLLALPRMGKRMLMYIADAAMLPLLMLAAFMIRLDRGFFLPVDIWLLPAAAAVTIAILHLSGFYRMVIRFMGSGMAYSIVLSTLLASVVLAALAYMVPATATPVPCSLFLPCWPSCIWVAAVLLRVVICCGRPGAAPSASGW